MKENLNDQSFRDWFIDELKKLDVDVLASVINTMLDKVGYRDDRLLAFDVETINEMYPNPYDAVIAFLGCGSSIPDYFQVDSRGGVTVFDNFTVYDLIHDYEDELIKYCERYKYNIDPHDYEIVDRIKYLAEDDPSDFSAIALNYLETHDISDFCIEDYEDKNEDCDFISAFEEYVEEQLEDQEPEEEESEEDEELPELDPPFNSDGWWDN